VSIVNYFCICFGSVSSCKTSCIGGGEKIVRYGKDTVPPDFGVDEKKGITWDVFWFGDESQLHVDAAIIEVDSGFTVKQIVVYNSSYEGVETRIAIYKQENGSWRKIYVTDAEETYGGWKWQLWRVNYPDGIPLSPGVYAIVIKAKDGLGSVGVPVELTGEAKCFRWGYREEYKGFPDILPDPPNITMYEGVASVYLDGEEAPIPLQRPESAMVIPTLRNMRSCMRGYGGFPELWTTEEYRFVRMQVYGSLEEDGSITPKSNWDIGNEGGATWEVIEQFLANVAVWNGIPNLSLWIHNFEDLADKYAYKEDYSAFVIFFTRLKELMERYGINEMILEPAWEFNQAEPGEPVSPAQQRNGRIEPFYYKYGMAAIRRARDEVGINCSIVAHMIALHGDAWTDPNYETWKRTFCKPWFDGMAFADVVTVSLYLHDDDPKWTGDWLSYLDWIYEKVIGLQKGETGWLPAVYVGFSEHNLNDGEITDTNAIDRDFHLFSLSGCTLMGWWLDFSLDEIRSYVNNKACELQTPPTPKCFIATAAYGSPLAPQLSVLRWFRDRCLPVKLANVYYKLSPPVARFIWRHQRLRTATRICLKPIIAVVNALRGQRVG